MQNFPLVWWPTVSIGRAGKKHTEDEAGGDTRCLKNLIKDNGIKAIFHLAAQIPDGNSPKNPSIYFETNVRGTLNLLDTAYQNGVEKFIYASSMSVYSEPPCYLPVDEEHPTKPVASYGASKMSGEFYCNLYAKVLDIAILRYSATYGPRDRKSSLMLTFCRQALKNEPVTIYGDGTQSSDFVYIDDTVRGTLLVWDNNKSGIYNIGSGEETSVKRLAERIIYITGSDSEIVFVKKDTDRPFRFYLDISKSRKELSYSPLLLDQGLRIYAKALYREVDKRRG